MSGFKDTLSSYQETWPRKTSSRLTTQAPSMPALLAAQEPPALHLILIYKNPKVLNHLPTSKGHSSSS